MTSGYAKQQTMALENASPEQTLAWGLTTTARRMSTARAEGATRDQVLEAVRLNWRLWTIIQAEQADPDCATPRSIREGLLNLSNFVDKQSVDILANPQPAKLEVLININRNIAAGLLGTDLAPEQRMGRDRPQGQPEAGSAGLVEA